MIKRIWRLNTSNLGKFEEFKILFAQQGCDLKGTHVDLIEIDSDPITVVTEKASQLGEHIVVDDTSLEVEGADIGVNVRWILDHLSQLVGRKAIWTVLLAYREDNKIMIFEGKIEGRIVHSSGNAGFGFDPVFQPNGSSLTLAQSKPDEFNARALAVEALIRAKPLMTRPVIKNWKGPRQNSNH